VIIDIQNGGDTPTTCRPAGAASTSSSPSRTAAAKLCAPDGQDAADALPGLPAAEGATL